jgi:hypothetical protein
VIIPNQMACGSQNEGCCSCGAFLMIMTSSKGRLNRTVMKDLEDLLQ